LARPEIAGVGDGPTGHLMVRVGGVPVMGQDNVRLILPDHLDDAELGLPVILEVTVREGQVFPHG